MSPGRSCPAGSGRSSSCRAGPDSTIAPEVAPGQDTLGVLLPYTPLHHLLIEPAPGFPEALVMTSGNRSEEPIAFEDDQARADAGAAGGRLPDARSADPHAL